MGLRLLGQVSLDRQISQDLVPSDPSSLLGQGLVSVHSLVLDPDGPLNISYHVCLQRTAGKHLHRIEQA